MNENTESLRARMLPVLDGAVERGDISRDEAFALLDAIDPDRDYAERLMRAYWQQRDEGRAMSDTAWVPTAETDRMVAALQKAGTPGAKHALAAGAEEVARAVARLQERGTK